MLPVLTALLMLGQFLSNGLRNSEAQKFGVMKWEMFAECASKVV